MKVFVLSEADIKLLGELAQQAPYALAVKILTVLQGAQQQQAVSPNDGDR